MRALALVFVLGMLRPSTVLAQETLDDIAPSDAPAAESSSAGVEPTQKTHPKKNPVEVNGYLVHRESYTQVRPLEAVRTRDVPSLFELNEANIQARVPLGSPVDFASAAIRGRAWRQRNSDPVECTRASSSEPTAVRQRRARFARILLPGRRLYLDGVSRRRRASGPSPGLGREPSDCHHVLDECNELAATVFVQHDAAALSHRKLQPAAYQRRLDVGARRDRRLGGLVGARVSVGRLELHRMVDSIIVWLRTVSRGRCERGESSGSKLQRILTEPLRLAINVRGSRLLLRR